MTPAGMCSKEFCPHGREAQSIAFFNTAGIDRLYSGVRNKIASPRRSPLSGPDLGRVVSVVILAVEREVADGDLDERQVIRG